MSFLRNAALFLVLAAWPLSVTAAPITVDFEGFSDLDVLTNQVVGVTFDHATVLTAGVSLNEFEFPPHSGTNVLFDDGGPIGIDFAASVFRVGGYFTYLAPVTISAFDTNSVLVGSTTSAFTANMGLSGASGSTPNEWLAVSSSTAISRVVLTGDAFGGSFTLDDLTYDTEPKSVPEPATGLLALLGILVLAPTRRKL